MAYGQNGHIGISFQDSFGTANVDSMDYFTFVSESISENIEELLSESLSARYEEPDAYNGMTDISGDIVTEIHPHTTGKLLMAWAGQESVAFVGSCYSHLMVPINDDWDAEVSALQPCTIEIYRDTGSAYQYFDMLCNQLVLEISQGALYRCTASWIGANFAFMNKSTPSYVTGSLFTWDTVSVSLAGTGINDVSDLTITLNNNLEGFAYLDLQRTYGRILRNGYRTIETGGTMLLVGDDEYRNYRDGTLQRLIVTATQPNTIMDAHNQVEIDIPKMKYRAFDAPLDGVGLVDATFEGKGTYDTTSSYAVKFTVVNTNAAYD
jgi:hypothetical protein